MLGICVSRWLPIECFLSSFHFHFISVHYSHSPRYMQCPTLIFSSFSILISNLQLSIHFFFFFFSPSFDSFDLVLSFSDQTFFSNQWDQQFKDPFQPLLAAWYISSLLPLSRHLWHRWQTIGLRVSSPRGIFACIRDISAPSMHLLSDLRAQSIPATGPDLFCSLPEFGLLSYICTLPFGAGSEPGPSYFPSPLVMRSPGSWRPWLWLWLLTPCSLKIYH